MVMFVIYVISSIWTIKKVTNDGNYFSFHTLFLISFLFVNFIYPTLIFPVDPEYFTVFKRSFNYDIITKCTALALMGSSSYQFGVFMSYRPHKNVKSVAFTDHRRLDGLVLYLVPFLIVLFLLVLLFGGVGMLKGQFGSTDSIPSGLLILFQVTIGTAVMLSIYNHRDLSSVFRLFRRINPVLLIILFLFVLLFVYVGDRGPVIQIALISIGFYGLFIKPIKLGSLLAIVVAGMLVLTFLSYARSREGSAEGGLISRGASNMEVGSFVDLGMDLIINNRNLYVGYEYANSNGFAYGKGMFHYVFAPFPFVPSLLTKFLFDSTPGDLTSARIITDDAEASYGLGSNMIADLYMQFGVLGVISFMFLLGFVVQRLLHKIDKNSVMSVIAYGFLIAYSIYVTRTSVLDPIRFICWGIAIYIIFAEFSRKPKQGKA